MAFTGTGERKATGADAVKAPATASARTKESVVFGRLGREARRSSSTSDASDLADDHDLADRGATFVAVLPALDDLAVVALLGLAMPLVIAGVDQAEGPVDPR